MAHDEKQIKILEGEEAQRSLGDRELIHLTNRVNELERGETVGQLRHTIAKGIYQLLGKGNTQRKLVRSIDPAFGPIEHMQSLREFGNIAVAKDGEKTVGMIGFEYAGTDPSSGREVYEIRRLSVRKEYEGRGIGSQLHKVMFEKIQSIDPNALILIETKTPKIVKQCQEMGYKPYPLKDCLFVKYGEEVTAENQTHEYEFWIHDLSSKDGGAGENRTRE